MWECDVVEDIMTMTTTTTQQMAPTPFAVGALNTLGGEEKCEAFQFFAAVYNYNVFDQVVLMLYYCACCHKSDATPSDHSRDTAAMARMGGLKS
jgi:hypothetical protein